MAAVLSIYALGVLLCLAAGVALAGLLDRRGRWVGYATVPLGLCALIALLYPLGALMPGYRVAPVAIAIVAAALALAVALRTRVAEPGRRVASLLAAVRPTWAEAAVLVWGAIVGFLILAPTIEQGFATTIAVSNNDGWGYAALVDWIKDHPLPRDVEPNLAEPLSFVPWSSMRFDFGIGFEHFAAVLATVLDRQGYEVVNAAAAVGLAAAAGGWATLAAALRPRVPPLWIALAVVAVASPIAALPFIENYTTQFVSICLWPFAVAAFVHFASAPRWRSLAVAAIAGGALVGVYPAVAPWLVLPIVAIALLLVPEAPSWARGRLARLGGAGLVRRAGRAAVVVATFAVAVLVVSPIQVVRGVQNLLFLDDAPINAIAGFYSDEAYAALFLGAAPAFSLFGGGPLGWPAYAGIAILAAAFAVALVPLGRLRAPRAVLLATGGGILVTMAAILLRYRVLDELPYQVYKGLISAGAVLAGIVVIGLIPSATSRARGLRLLALGCIVAVWIPITSQNLEASVNPGTGFRQADVEMARALDDLPDGSVVLVEGSGADAASFQYRMMAAYFGDRAPERTAVGLGTTATYLTPGGLPEWRPSRPWTHVLQSRAEPIASDRHLLWANRFYALSEAPVLDVTTYGPGWYPPIVEDELVFAQTADTAELVVSNRDSRAHRARLRMEVTSYGRPRTLTLTTEEGVALRPLSLGAPSRVSLDLVVPPNSATPVSIDARPSATAARPGDGQPVVLRVQSLRVTDARG
jgi:hypothetical protein